MKKLIVLLLLVYAPLTFGQLDSIQLTNALVVGQLDNPEERYALEGALSNLLKDHGVKATPSLNYSKHGGDAAILASDSIMNILAEKGIDTYILVTVRGYDRRFKPTTRKDSLAEKLKQVNLYELYRLDAVNVSFEFTFYRDGKFIASDIVKCGNISDRESVLKRFTRKTAKRIEKKWKP